MVDAGGTGVRGGDLLPRGACGTDGEHARPALDRPGAVSGTRRLTADAGRTATARVPEPARSAVDGRCPDRRGDEVPDRDGYLSWQCAQLSLSSVARAARERG